MALAQPTLKAADPPFGAIVARQLSVWPFAARTQRLFLLVDQSVPDPTLRQGLLRAMQQAYFSSDSFSQTRSVREAALAAHYVLRHHNREVLPENQICAATGVAAIRGNLAYVALAGDSAAFAWRDGVLTGQRDLARLQRPLGMEQDPRVTLWSTPLGPGDRLVLVCGANWNRDSQREIEQILSTTPGADAAEALLGELLRGARPAGVLVVDPARVVHRQRHLVLVSSVTHGRAHPSGRATPGSRPARAKASGDSPSPSRARWLSPLTALALLGAVILAALNPLATPGGSGDLVSEVTGQQEGVSVSPAMAVRLGPSGGNVVDLAVGSDALYTLDVVEGTVRVFGLDARDQQPGPDTLLVRAGQAIAGSPRRLAPPVAIQYLSGSGTTTEPGQLAIVDQARSVVQVGPNRSLSARPLPSSGSWRELGALGVDAGHLFVLDSGTRRLLEYPLKNQRLVDTPRLVLDDELAPTLPLDRAAEVVAQDDVFYLRMIDGTLRRFDKQAGEVGFAVSPPDARTARFAGIALDRAGGLYLAEPANARILHTTADGAVMRQLRNPALAGLRQIQSSLDGHRLFGLVASGVLVFDIPEAVPQ
jgi:hypothetical protein